MKVWKVVEGHLESGETLSLIRPNGSVDINKLTGTKTYSHKLGRSELQYDQTGLGRINIDSSSLRSGDL